MNHKFYTILITILAVVALVGCGPQVQTGAEAGVNIELEAMGGDQAVGETMLMVKMTDTSGSPISDATLNVQGDMTHAGMVPVIRDIEGGEDGVYSVPFEWTMGGDWIVTVSAILADGTEVAENFDLSVASDGDMASEHDDHGEGHDGHGEMAMDDDIMAAVEALDVSSLHDVDVGLNEDGTLDASYAETVDNFAMAFSMVSWPEEKEGDAAAASGVLTALKGALESENLEAAQPLAAEAHELVHDLVDSIMEAGEHDH